MFIFLIILSIVALYIYQQDQRKHYRPVRVMVKPHYDNDSIEVLRQRYACGEIDEQEFKERKAILEHR